jgi:hypothetical protein
MSESIDGIYAAYMSGKAGQGLAVLVFRREQIVGADTAGVVYDGRYVPAAANLSITLTAKAPPNTLIVQGGQTGPEGEQNELSFAIPHDFTAQNYIRVETRHGPINVRLVKLRDLND